MTTLTKNRILQAGDEYQDRESWKPVSADQYGLQIMFSKYNCPVRRPSEKPSPTPLAQPCTPTPKNASSGEPAKGTATIATPTVALIANPVSRELKPLTEKTLMEAVRSLIPSTGVSPSTDRLNVRYPALCSPCSWIGRNGTYNQKAINLIGENGKVRIVPQGVRGIARNAQVEFPVECIPQIADWLLQYELQHKLKGK